MGSPHHEQHNYDALADLEQYIEDQKLENGNIGPQYGRKGCDEFCGSQSKLGGY